MSVAALSEIDSLLDVSARIGGEPLLVQGATGNTSIKRDGVLWIKASGKWLAHATQSEILTSVNLAEALRQIDQNSDPGGQSAVELGKPLGTSVETAMHVVLPHRVVLHVHSVNTIAWAVRRDGREELTSRLEGIQWRWIPYVPSGLSLARAIEAVVARGPQTRVFVLANHGLVVCAEDCEAAEELLRQVEQRVAIFPRRAPEAEWELLNWISKSGSWRTPPNIAIHSIATDRVSRRIVVGGVLYPCQAIFLAPRVRTFPRPVAGGYPPKGDLDEIDEPFLIIEDAGVLVRQKPNPTESATLAGLAQVLQRIPESAPLQYLREEQVRDLLSGNLYRYRELAEGNATGGRA